MCSKSCSGRVLRSCLEVAGVGIQESLKSVLIHYWDHVPQSTYHSQAIYIDPPSKRSSTYNGPRLTNIRPVSMRPTSQVVMPPASTKEPAILATWGAKSPSLRPTSHFSDGRPISYHSQTLNDSVTSRHQPVRSPLSQTSFPKSEPRVLSQEDVEAMFSGAPVFEVVDGSTGPRPFVTLRRKDGEGSELVKDTVNFAHPAYAATSLGGAVDADEVSNTNNVLLEIPDMRSLAGRDAGSVGYEYFLQLSISDSNLVADGSSTFSDRIDLISNPEKFGLRPLDLGALISHLSQLSESQHFKKDGSLAATPNEQRVAEMYTELFSRLLVTPKFSTAISSETDPTGLEVQIASLAQVLDAGGIWFDFSYMEWRIRLGQLLWSTAAEEETDGGDGKQQQGMSERDIVLLQIALASELQLRLQMSERPTKARALSRKIHWDLVLARRFMNNVRIMQKPVDDERKNVRNSVFSALTFVTANENLEESVPAPVEPVLYPRHEERQFEGLLRFADALSWPHTQDIRSRYQSRTQQQSLLTPGPATAVTPASTAYAKPVTTPNQTLNDQTTGYFTRPRLGQRTSTAQSIQLYPVSTNESMSPNAGGWLSRSWLTGLILPGEPASHILMSTLLESSPQAIASLGDSANLYGGFIYNDRSYWSKSCIVGRVLAAETGAGECMGWISSPGVPCGNDKSTQPRNEWVNIEMKEVQTTTPARISSKDLVSKESAFVPSKIEADGEISSDKIDEDDFTWPIDGPPVMGNEARYEGLVLEPSSTPSLFPKPSSPDAETESTRLASVPTSTAILRFASKLTSRQTRISIPLIHDVHFISSFPCFPSPRLPGPVSLTVTRSHTHYAPSSPSLSPLLRIPTADEKELPDPPCHPLHEAYSMEIVPAATLLSASQEDYARPEDGRVLVLDCRGDEGLELLARAWCARVGEHAVIGRVGRTCLSCCVREARGLGVGVVLRV